MQIDRVMLDAAVSRALEYRGKHGISWTLTDGHELGSLLHFLHCVLDEALVAREKRARERGLDDRRYEPPPPKHGSKGYSSTLRELEIGENAYFADARYTSMQSTAFRVLGKGNFEIRYDGSGVRVWRMK